MRNTDEEEQRMILKYWFNVKRAVDELNATDGWIPVAPGRRRKQKGKRR